MALRSIITIGAALIAYSCFGNEVAPPPLTQNGLIGTWEGADIGFFRWYRMEIFNGGGYLAVSETLEGTVYKLEYSKISGTNNVKLRFRNTNPNSSFPEAMLIDAIGYGLDQDHGELHATITNYIANLRDKSQVYFTKGTRSSRDVVKRLKDAERLIRDARRKHL